MSAAVRATITSANSCPGYEIREPVRRMSEHRRSCMAHVTMLDCIVTRS